LSARKRFFLNNGNIDWTLVDLGFNMGKIANVSDNLPQKLTLAIKSGKHKVGKLIESVF